MDKPKKPRKDREEESLHGWAEIAEFMQRSIQTCIRLAKQERLPITLLGGIPYAAKRKLKRYLRDKLDNEPYYEIKDLTLGDKRGVRPCDRIYEKHKMDLPFDKPETDKKIKKIRITR